MGSVVSSPFRKAGTEVRENVQAAVIRSKLTDLRQKKKERDFQIAMRIATLRDRVHWLFSFYTVMLGVNVVRRLKLGKFEVMPISYMPYLITPFLFLYQADFAYGKKAERINFETNNIIRNENHWFNEPLRLPKQLEQHYRQMQQETNEELRKLGHPEEPDWAVFDDDISDDQLVELSYPVTRLLLRHKVEHAEIEQPPSGIRSFPTKVAADRI